MPRCAVLWDVESRPNGYHQLESIARAIKQVAVSLGSASPPAVFNAYSLRFGSLDVFMQDEMRAEFASENVPLITSPAHKTEHDIERAVSADILAFALSVSPADRQDWPTLLLIVPDPVPFLGALEVLRSRRFRVGLVVDRTEVATFSAHADALYHWDKVMGAYLYTGTIPAAFVTANGSLRAPPTDDEDDPARELHGLFQGLSTRHNIAASSILSPPASSSTVSSALPPGLGLEARAQPHPQRETYPSREQSSSRSAAGMFSLGAVVPRADEDDDVGLIWCESARARPQPTGEVLSAVLHARVDEADLPDEDDDQQSARSSWDNTFEPDVAVAQSADWDEALSSIASTAATGSKAVPMGRSQSAPFTRPSTIPGAGPANGRFKPPMAISLHSNAGTPALPTAATSAARPSAASNAWSKVPERKATLHARKRDEFFAPLLAAIESAIRAEGTTRVSRGRVGSELKSARPNIYDSLGEGISCFGDYARAAEKAGRVVLEANTKHGLISIAPAPVRARVVVAMDTGTAKAAVQARALKGTSAKGKGPGRPC